jgi:penicillin-insensitive murein endopeptidase
MFSKYKKITQGLFGFTAMAVSLNSFAGSTAHDWARITSPTQIEGTGQSIGTYTNGCISGAQTLPLEGTGYQVMRLSRKRYYGHANLIEFIQTLGEAAVAEKIGTLLIGDLGQPRGGPTLSGHRSHQNGLDVDIWFLLSEQANKHTLTESERENWSASSMVNLANYEIDNHWSPAHEKVLELAAQQSEVERIFVNPSIKRELCQHKTAQSREWLRKIRPWWKHDDHFHVRLKCPDNNRHCDKQEPLPSGDGCDAGLDWWFTEEARHPKRDPHKSAPPPLPALCEQILNE